MMVLDWVSVRWRERLEGAEEEIAGKMHFS